jgi:putative RecB family exonuclease
MTPNTSDKPHLSYSQISTYLMCPLRYRFHYVDQIAPAFTSAPLAFWSAIHEAVGALFQSHLEGDPLSVENMFDVYRQIWLSQSQAQEIRFFNGDTTETLPVKAKRMLEVFHAAFDPAAQIIGIEEPFEVDLGKRMPPLVGWIDAVEQAPDGAISIVDLKTASKPWAL